MIFFGPLHVVNCKLKNSSVPLPPIGLHNYSGYKYDRHNRLYRTMYSVLEKALLKEGQGMHQLQIRVIELRSPEEHIRINKQEMDALQRRRWVSMKGNTAAADRLHNA